MKVDVCIVCGEWHSEYDECPATGYARKTEKMDKQVQDKEKIDNREKAKKDMRRPPVDKMVRWEYRKN